MVRRLHPGFIGPPSVTIRIRSAKTGQSAKSKKPMLRTRNVHHIGRGQWERQTHQSENAANGKMSIETRKYCQKGSAVLPKSRRSVKKATNNMQPGNRVSSPWTNGHQAGLCGASNGCARMPKNDSASDGIATCCV